MLQHHRRYWLFLIAVILLAPGGAHLWHGGNALSVEEKRALAQAPSLPARVSDWKRWPASADAYLRDRFGLRDTMIRVHTALTYGLLGRQGNGQVLLGADGWMFYRGDKMLQQSAGVLVRPDFVEHTANILAEMRGLLTARGIKLIVAPPPNSATIYADKIDAWPSAQPTEYDLLLQLLSHRGVAAVDLRPVLRRARAQGDTYYRHDTHWNAPGTVAGFNAVVDAAGIAEWRFDLATVLGPAESRLGGDLAHMLSLAKYVTEFHHPLKIANFERRELSVQPLVDITVPGVTAGPTILILGDSFTRHMFPPMIAAQGGRAIWTHHYGCKFDWSWIEKYHPDQVWYMPTERLMPCLTGARPVGMPAMVSEGVGKPDQAKTVPISASAR